MAAEALTAARVEEATLPVIDLSALQGSDQAAIAATAAALGQAARTSGFFYITGHGVAQSLIEEMFAASKAFHALPRAEKMTHWCGFSTNHRGYVPFEENGRDFPKRINMNDAWDMSYEAPADHPDHVAGWRMTGPNVWPEIPGWRETVSSYYDAVFALGRRMMGALALELGVSPEELFSQITCPTSQLRMLRYVPN
ncbi:MAG: 2-oxoglutarate and iron-dependent oxygenase domain-containing protein, partial [Pseudomonadota bacterium]